MRSRFVNLIVVVAASLALPALMLAQMPAPESGAAKAKGGAQADAHNLSGMWNFYNNTPGQGIYATPSKDAPPMTDWAKARYAQAKPGYGPKAQAGGNDPILRCYPSGIPRLLFFPQPFEIVQASDRVFMFFEREHEFRQIWTDGHSHPKDVEPTWMGDSVGKWEGDTFVVDTVGLTERSWLDFYGDPHSDDIHMIERYKRTAPDSLTLQLIVEDPKAYTKTWVGDTKIYKLLAGKKAYMEELPCIFDEENSFTDRIRMPAVKGPNKK
jgi:hypothetical protein